MSDPIVLYNERMAWLERAQDALDDMERAGRDKADAERRYRKARALKTAELRVDGTPVTIIDDLVLGDDNVAALRMEFHIAESDYETSRMAHHLCKDRARILDEQMRSEYRFAGYDM